MKKKIGTATFSGRFIRPLNERQRASLHFLSFAILIIKHLLYKKKIITLIRQFVFLNFSSKFLIFSINQLPSIKHTTELFLNILDPLN